MTFVELLKTMGIETQTFIAGMSGGVAFLTKIKDMTWFQRFLTVLSGGLTANYLTPFVSELLHFDEKALYGVAFILGYSGMKSVEKIMQVFNARIGNSFRKNNDNEL